MSRRLSRLIAAPDGAHGAVVIHADALIHAGLLDGQESADLALDPTRKAYVHVARGTLKVNGHLLAPGDTALLENENRVTFSGGNHADVLVFELAT